MTAWRQPSDNPARSGGLNAPLSFTGYYYAHPVFWILTEWRGATSFDASLLTPESRRKRLFFCLQARLCVNPPLNMALPSPEVESIFGYFASQPSAVWQIGCGGDILRRPRDR